MRRRNSLTPADHLALGRDLVALSDFARALALTVAGGCGKTSPELREAEKAIRALDRLRELLDARLWRAWPASYSPLTYAAGSPAAVLSAPAGSEAPAPVAVSVAVDGADSRPNAPSGAQP